MNSIITTNKINIIFLILLCLLSLGFKDLKEETIFKLPYNLNYTFLIKNVKQKCPDLKPWNKKKRYFSSVYCGNKFTKTSNSKMIFEFEVSLLLKIELYQRSSNKKTILKKFKTLVKDYSKLYGMGEKYDCSFVENDKKNICTEFIWENKKNRFFMTLYKDYGTDSFTIYRSWHKKI